MNQQYIDQISVIAQSNNIPLSTEICKAIKEYIGRLSDEKEMIAGSDVWELFYKNATKEQMLEMSTVICEVNNRILKKLCQ